jgi:hypothetical protein
MRSNGDKHGAQGFTTVSLPRRLKSWYSEEKEKDQTDTRQLFLDVYIRKIVKTTGFILCKGLG